MKKHEQQLDEQQAMDVRRHGLQWCRECERVWMLLEQIPHEMEESSG